MMATPVTPPLLCNTKCSSQLGEMTEWHLPGSSGMFVLLLLSWLCVTVSLLQAGLLLHWQFTILPAPTSHQAATFYYLQLGCQSVTRSQPSGHWLSISIYISISRLKISLKCFPSLPFSSERSDTWPGAQLRWRMPRSEESVLTLPGFILYHQTTQRERWREERGERGRGEIKQVESIVNSV